jgi:histidine triad (HIT) family protein
MPTLFTRIIAGELPARFLWKDERCVVFLDAQPLRPGHALVVPRVEVDQWLDITADLAAHLMTTAHALGRAQMRVFRPARVGLMIAGMGVPHVHLHVVPIERESDLHFENAERNPDPRALDSAAAAIRAELVALGYPHASA